MTPDPRLVAVTEKHAAVVRARGGKDGRTGWQHFRISLPWKFLLAIDKAAKRRGVGRATYIRRVLAHWVAADLEMEPSELLSLCPRPLRWGEVGGTGRNDGRDDGAGFGDWDLVRRG